MEKERNHELDCPYDFTSRCTMGRCDCKLKVKSNRELALEWWNNLPTWGISSKEYYMGVHYSDDDVTDEKIEEIWKRKIKPNDWKNLPNTMMKAKALYVGLNNIAKANTKQFKEFNPELFKAYINKFSNEDKIRAISILSCEISTIDSNFNSLLNRISSYGRIKD